MAKQYITVEFNENYKEYVVSFDVPGISETFESQGLTLSDALASLTQQLEDAEL